jgi:glycosyltransferase involved in cell wall biosynthesis
MKIGIDARLWTETGVGRYIRNLVKYLQIVDKKNDYVLFVRSDDVGDINFEIRNSNFEIRLVDIRWHTMSEQLYFRKILEKESLDLMHFPYFSLPYMYNRPYIVTIHDLIIHHFPTGKASTLPLPIYHLKRLGYKIILNKAVEKAGRIIVPLQSTKDDVIATLKVKSERIIVTYEGVDEAVLNSETKKIQNKLKTLNNRYFLYVGNVYPHKNIETLIEAFLSLSSEMEDTQLILVGKEDYFYKKIEDRIIKEKIINIKILHDVSDEDLTQMYSNAIAVVMPSFMEGFGLVPLEAMANNCPVIVSDIPAHKEVCRDAAWYFKPTSIKDLSDLLLRFIINKANDIERKRIKGYQRVKDFSWLKMAKETVAIYEQYKR